LDIVAAAGRLLAGLSILVTLLPLTRARAWWVRAWDFPRQQIMVAGLLAGGLIWAGGGTATHLDQALLAALALALAWQLGMILPYTPLWRRQGKRTRSLPARGVRLVVVNVLMTNRKVEELAASLAATDPDLVLALETDAWWVERLAEILPDHGHRILHPLDNTYGLALFSRLELLHPKLRFLLREGVPSIRTRVRLRSGEDIVLIGLHPEPPSPTEADSSLPRDAELVMVGREIAGEAKPVIVAGDLNDVAWSRTSRLFRRLSGLIDPRIGRGFYNSFHAHHPWLRWPLDHVFYSPEFLLHGLQRLPAFGSDHFPILIDLEYHPRAAALQDVDPAEHGDHREARETLAEAAAVEGGRA
jgi:endonuclease/exonuclease/phosphatase (EEP) superfamily protein YafD